jgi:hypothetical protein
MNGLVMNLKLITGISPQAGFGGLFRDSQYKLIVVSELRRIKL